MSLDSILANIYDRDAEQASHSIEKTAEATMISALTGEGHTEKVASDLSQMSIAELAALATDLEEGGSDKTASVQDGEDLSELEKIAQDKLGGEVMAHSMVHEFGLIKQAMAGGLCRVCKTNNMDISGTSICSGCAPE